MGRGFQISSVRWIGSCFLQKGKLEIQTGGIVIFSESARMEYMGSSDSSLACCAFFIFVEVTPCPNSIPGARSIRARRWNGCLEMSQKIRKGSLCRHGSSRWCSQMSWESVSCYTCPHYMGRTKKFRVWPWHSCQNLFWYFCTVAQHLPKPPWVIPLRVDQWRR